MAGLHVVSAVTKKPCDVLVAADTSSNLGKATKAHKYGIPVISIEEFVDRIER